MGRNIVATTSADVADPILDVADPIPDVGYQISDPILELFENCIKLASQNKINQKNTWDLALIDHLSEIVKEVEEANDCATNFQKASCALEVGVKIYSTRVDSAHSAALKILGSLNRVSRGDKQGFSTKEENESKPRHPTSTLKPFDAITLKKIDVAFVVDPLFHQTSALFDEGGAKGLLLNNLGIYGNCQVVFDSLEVPGKCVSSVSPSDGTETIDLSFAKDSLKQMVSGIQNTTQICPSLSAVVNQFDKDNRRPSEVYSSEQVNENSETWEVDNDDQAFIFEYGNYDQADEEFNYQDAVEDDRFLFVGISTEQELLSSPSYWKYKGKAKENGSRKAKKTRNNKADSELEFSNAVDMDLSHIFAPPKNPKSLVLAARKAPCNTTLPEYNYQLENLAKLFLLPNVLCSEGGGSERTEETIADEDGFGGGPIADEDGFGGGPFDDGHAHKPTKKRRPAHYSLHDSDYSDNDEAGNKLVAKPRQVQKIKLHYDKTSKQVDVHALKEALWCHIQNLYQISVHEEASEETISFRHVLRTFPDACTAATSLNDISPHLYFLCLLQLANEHGLEIYGCEALDELNIHVQPH